MQDLFEEELEEEPLESEEVFKELSPAPALDARRLLEEALYRRKLKKELADLEDLIDD